MGDYKNCGSWRDMFGKKINSEASKQRLHEMHTDCDHWGLESQDISGQKIARFSSVLNMIHSVNARVSDTNEI